jgi:mgtE-like transporter
MEEAARMTHESGKRSAFAAFRETLLAFAFDLGGLVAGFVVASQLGVFQLSPWAIAIYPAVLGVKGVIHGLLSRRIGTALHLGTVYPRFFNNTKSFYKLVSATIVITLVMGVVMSLFSLVFGSLFWGATLADSLGIVSVIVASMSLGLTFSFVTIKVAFVTFKSRLDPDIVVYPMMSTLADIFITFCYVFALDAFFLFSFAGGYTLTAIILAHLILVFYLVPKNLREKDFRKNLKESLFTLFFVSIIVNVTGTVLKGISSIVGNRGREIYTVYPALLDVTGDVSAVVGSTATTKLALGLLRPSLSSIVHHLKNIFSAWTASVLVFLVLAFISPLLNSLFSLSAFTNLLSILLLANLIAVFGIVVVSYGVSILTFQKGLDPDNLVIPLESSFADSLMSIALFVVVFLVG